MTTELIISKEWLKPKNPCADGYRWYLEKFPQGASFGVVYRALRGDARYSDADWLVDAATTGDRANAATTGESAVSASLGYGAKAMAGIGGAIVLTHRDDDGKLLHIKASMVGENDIKPNVWYSLNASGEFVEVV